MLQLGKFTIIFANFALKYTEKPIEWYFPFLTYY
jgi:hypothetical protein